MLGHQLLIDLFDCDQSVIDDLKKIENVITILVGHLDAKIIQVLTHRFDPQGISCLALISASHISIHTWPENNFTSIDIFSCSSKINTLVVMNTLKEIFHTNRLAYSETFHGRNLESAAFKGKDDTSYELVNKIPQ